jgi:hypothetical protein
MPPKGNPPANLAAPPAAVPALPAAPPAQVPLPNPALPAVVQAIPAPVLSPEDVGCTSDFENLQQDAVVGTAGGARYLTDIENDCRKCKSMGLDGLMGGHRHRVVVAAAQPLPVALAPGAIPLPGPVLLVPPPALLANVTDRVRFTLTAWRAAFPVDCAPSKLSAWNEAMDVIAAVLQDGSAAELAHAFLASILKPCDVLREYALQDPLPAGLTELSVAAALRRAIELGRAVCVILKLQHYGRIAPRNASDSALRDLTAPTVHVLRGPGAPIDVKVFVASMIGAKLAPSAVGDVLPDSELYQDCYGPGWLGLMLLFSTPGRAQIELKQVYELIVKKYSTEHADEIWTYQRHLLEEARSRPVAVDVRVQERAQRAEHDAQRGGGGGGRTRGRGGRGSTRGPRDHTPPRAPPHQAHDGARTGAQFGHPVQAPAAGRGGGGGRSSTAPTQAGRGGGGRAGGRGGPAPGAGRGSFRSGA